MCKSRILGFSLLIVLLVSLPLAAGSHELETRAVLAALAPSDPLGSFEGPGVPGTISWTGDGQKITNPSFETGSIVPWIMTQTFAAPGSGSAVTNTGFDGTKSVRLALLSGNLSTASSLFLLYGLSQEQAGFTSSVRLRAAVYTEELTGSSAADRAEVTIALSTSTGRTRALHYVFAGSKPIDTASDAYITVPGGPVTGQWLTADINVPIDAQSRFTADFATFNAVQEIRLSVYAQTVGNQTDDPHIRYVDTSSSGTWNFGESTIYDTNLNSTYDSGEQILSGSPPSLGANLIDDFRMKYVDSNNNNIWDNESIVYDSNNDGYYDFLEPVVRAPTPPSGTLLMKPLQRVNRSLFDRIELYTASGSRDWILNGGFETGLTGWRANSSFTSSTSVFISGTSSARGAVTNGAAELSQSLDARPLVDSTTLFTASVNIETMSGTTAQDYVQMWLGLTDSQERPVSLYYVFRTGDGTVPTNRNDSVYVNATGGLNQWLSIDATLLQEASVFTSLGYVPPYNVEIIVLEIGGAGPSGATTAYFDRFSILNPPYLGTSSSYFYAADAANSTYVHTASSIPHGSLHLEVPSGQVVLNVTSPSGTALGALEYSTSIGLGARQVDIPDSTMFLHAPTGDWRVFTTSKNAVSVLYVEDIITKRPAIGIDVGSTVNLVSLSEDPSGAPLLGASITLTLWDTNSGVNVASWPGTTNGQGWWNVSGIVLPPAGIQPGSYKLQASVFSTYAGLRTFQVSIFYILILSLTVSSAQLSAGSSVTVSGDAKSPTTNTPRPGINVTIYYRRAGDSTWTSLSTVVTNNNGEFSYTWTPPEGDYQVVASIGDPLTSSTQSQPEQILVGPGVFTDPLLILLIIAVVAAGIVLAMILRRRPKAKSSP